MEENFVGPSLRELNISELSETGNAYDDAVEVPNSPYTSNRIVVRELTIPSQAPPSYDIGNELPEYADKPYKSEKTVSILKKMLSAKDGSAGREDPKDIHPNYRLASERKYTNPARLEILSNRIYGDLRREPPLFSSNLDPTVRDIDQVLSNLVTEKSGSRKLGESVQFVASRLEQIPSADNVDIATESFTEGSLKKDATLKSIKSADDNERIGHDGFSLLDTGFRDTTDSRRPDRSRDLDDKHSDRNIDTHYTQSHKRSSRHYRDNERRHSAGYDRYRARDISRGSSRSSVQDLPPRSRREGYDRAYNVRTGTLDRFHGENADSRCRDRRDRDSTHRSQR
ncbi:hypothetical protein V1511DRAFT_341072 [Dipodascopsis uninucleata]